jgi:hypothetical protein
MQKFVVLIFINFIRPVFLALLLKTVTLNEILLFHVFCHIEIMLDVGAMFSTAW